MVNDENNAPVSISGETSIPEISSEVMSILGLTPQMIEENNRIKLAEQKLIEDLEEAGAKYYMSGEPGGPDNKYTFSEITVGQIKIPGLDHVPSQIPDYLLTYLWDSEQHRMELFPHEKDRSHLEAFVRGFGDQALVDCNWQTAVNAFDATSKDGILKNQTAINKLKDRKDVSAIVEIGKAITTRTSQGAKYI